MGSRTNPAVKDSLAADEASAAAALTEAHVNALLAATVGKSRPNLSTLALRLKSLDALALNMKFYGYEIARKLAHDLPVRADLRFASIGLTSKPCTQSDLESDWAAYWCGQLGIPVIFHRKIWEFVFFLQAAAEADVLVPGKRALGFGCGKEPLASYLAARGLDVTVTDLEPTATEAASWRQTNQHIAERDAAFFPHLVDRATFDRLVSHRFVDMNAIPDDLTGYDLAWSICALEHLGSIARAMTFIENSLAALKSGGYAIHTTEFNFLDDSRTIDNWPTVLPQQRHFTDLAGALRAKGHKVAALDFDVGRKPMDRFIDIPPYPGEGILERLGAAGDCCHLKLVIDGFTSTCFGLIIQKA